jgi:NAD(P)-dependent dehydrogenase (short-subunit alcohol dehydrogenase family)
MISVNNKTVFITGAGSGIGLATAKEFSQKGANVVIYSKDLEELKISDFPSKRTLIIKGDVTKRKEVSKAMKKAVQKFGSLDILINNAGVAKREDFLKTTAKDWNFLINVNIKGVFICIQEFIKLCQKSNCCDGKIIINISSGAGIYGIGKIAVYSATKAAVINITQGLSQELKNLGIKFITVCPGATQTKMFKKIFLKEKPFHTPEEVARVIYQTAVGKIKPDKRLIVDVFHHIKQIW